jgi:hypothetical protein
VLPDTHKDVIRDGNVIEATATLAISREPQVKMQIALPFQSSKPFALRERYFKFALA